MEVFRVEVLFRVEAFRVEAFKVEVFRVEEVLTEVREVSTLATLELTMELLVLEVGRLGVAVERAFLPRRLYFFFVEGLAAGALEVGVLVVERAEGRRPFFTEVGAGGGLEGVEWVWPWGKFSLSIGRVILGMVVGGVGGSLLGALGILAAGA